MLTDETVPAEGARYAAPLVLVPGLWSGRLVWRRFSTYLAHRGWECRLLDLRGVGNLDRRVHALGEYLAALPAPAVVVGHGAGGLVAHQAAEGRAAAVVMLAPVAPGEATKRTLVLGLRNTLAVAVGRPVAPPGVPVLDALVRDLVPAERATVLSQLGPDDGTALRDLVRGRVVLGRARVPTLVVAGARDPLSPPAVARGLAVQLGADVETLPDAGHWLLAGAAWQPTVGTIHRWIVRRLGEPLLETYAEAMADREAEDD